MKSCVNTSNPAFKQMAKDLGVDEARLELLAHQYNMEVAKNVGEEDSSAFLSDEGKKWVKEMILGISYEHRSSIPRVKQIVDEANVALQKAATTKEANAIVARTNESIAYLLSPEIQIASGYTGLRNGSTTGTPKLRLLESVANLEKPATREELNDLFKLLSSKFNKRFVISKTGSLRVRDMGDYFEVRVSENTLPSYTQLAEEMLHPLVENIQKDNPKLFKQFLQEVQNTKIPEIKVIRDGIYRNYSDKSIEEQDNELVTQTLAYELKNAEKSKLSLFQKFIDAIVTWLKEKGIISSEIPQFTLQHFAYALKFSSISFELGNMSRIYEHITTERQTISDSVKDNIEERPVLLNEYQRPIIESKELRGVLDDIKHFDSPKFGALLMDAAKGETKALTSIPYAEWKSLVSNIGMDTSALVDNMLDILNWNYNTANDYGYFKYNKKDKSFTIPIILEQALKFLNKYPNTAKLLNSLFKEEKDNLGVDNAEYLIVSIIEGAYYTNDTSIPNPSKVVNKLLQKAGMKWAYSDKNQLSLDFDTVEYLSTIKEEQQSNRNNTEDIQVEQASKNSQAEKVQKFLSDQQRFYNEIKAIQESGRLSNMEVRKVAADVAYAVSDLITQVQKGEVDINELVPGKETSKPISEMSRAEILQFIGVYSPKTETEEDSGAFSYVRRKYFGNLSAIKGEGEQLRANRRAAVTINNNFRAIVELAAEEFVNVEGFGLRVVEGKPAEVIESLNINIDDVNGDMDANEVLEREGDLQEHWQVNFRTIDVLGSMSQIVRQALLQCYKLDRDGNPIESRFGINERVSAREATSQILRWTQGAINMQSMIDKLQEHAKSNPWIQQIISRLEKGNKTDAEYGADTDFRSQFYNVFSKHFQLYTSIIKDVKTKEYRSVASNEHPALRDLLTQLQAFVATDQVPLFQGGRIDESKLALFKAQSDALPALNNKRFNELTAEEIDDIQDNIWAAMSYLGTNVTAEQIANSWTFENYKNVQSALHHISETLKRHLKDELYDPFEFQGGIKGNLSIALGSLIADLEDIAVSSFYDNGKTYQSYVTPSYLTKFMQKMRLQGEEFDTFVQDEFGQYDWFKQGDEWRNPWLRAIVEYGNDKCGAIPYRELLAHKVELNFDKHGYMREMTPSEYSLSLLTEYFSGAKGTGKESILPAWYRVPILSNKPSSEFIRFRRYADPSTYKENVVNDLMMVFSQELSRIKTTKARNEVYKKGSLEYIKNLDKNGSKFNFLPYLNNTDNARFNTLLEKKTDLHADVLSIEEEAELNTLARAEITKYMNKRSNDILTQWYNEGIMDAATNIPGITKGNVRTQLENFIWNDHLATLMIEELFVTDIALYKNTEDLQKRMAQIHAPGVRGDVNAVDYAGKRVSDGIYRTVLLKDFDGVMSNVIENIREVFTRREQRLQGTELAAAQKLHKEILKLYGGLKEEGNDKGINVADAQGYSCFTSRRKKDFIMGLWSREKEAAYKAYKRITDGNYTDDDLASIFNLTKIADACEPEKPFCYSQIKKSTNVPQGMSNYKLGVQYKNSEYLLIMADAILQHEKTSRANLLRAINTFMERSAELSEGRGIDTVQFESTAKALNQGAIDISQYQYEVGGENSALLALQRAAYTDENMTSYNLSVVHEVPFEDWCIQQPVPNHFYDHAQAQGSQGRMIIPSDLATMYNGEEVKYNVYGKEYTAQEFRKEYESNIAANIERSIEELSEELGLNLGRKERNVAIAEILQREIKSSPRYGTELLRACTLDENGEFMIPLSDPIQSKRIEQLLNSIIKNRVNKQEIAGGPVVQVSNFGTSQELNIRFKRKDGGLLATKAEFTVEAKKRGLSGEIIDRAYKDYVRDNQAGIAYYEVYAPRFDGVELYEDKFGNVDIERIERECPEMLEMIAYRIPTEDKYSMAPCKIVGFLPRFAGAGIMMPADITTITGSDFDVDKMYCMRKEFTVQQGTKGKRLYFPQDNTTIGRNNRIVEMYKAVLTHESTADKILNPGGFEPQKRTGYMVQAYKSNLNYTWEELQAIANGKTIEIDGEKLSGTDALKALSYKSSDLGFVDTQIQFYTQNSAASSILAIFAVAKVAHATLENNKFRVALNNTDIDGVGMLYPITIGDCTIGSNGDMTAEIDPTFNVRGEYIGKSLGSLIASAADAVKDPVLNLMNINKETVNVLNTLIRLGVPFELAALFLSQKVVTDTIQEYYKARLSNSTTLTKIITDRLSKYPDMGDAKKVNLTEEDLVKGLRDSDTRRDYQVLYTLDKVMRIANALQGINFFTRFNSIANAVGPLIIDNIIKDGKVNIKSFSQILRTLDNGAYSNYEVMQEVYSKHPIIKGFASTLEIARELFADMPEYNSLFMPSITKDSDIRFDNVVLRNRDLLNKYADFFKSYMLVDSGVVNVDELNYYVNEFAKDFIKYKKNDEYKDNLLIQMLRVAKDKAGSLYIKVDSSVLNDQTLKGNLSAAWADLLAKDKDLAIKLFKYCFFRGGIGFTPRTFMQLVPLELKQAIPGYVDTYRKSSISSLPSTFAKCFAQNNWRDYSVAPEIKLYNKEGEGMFTPHDGGLIEVKTSQCSSPYMKAKDKEGNYHLYQLQSRYSDSTSSIYAEIPILGGNGEYLEFAFEPASKPLEKVATSMENKSTVESNESAQEEADIVVDQEVAEFTSEFTHDAVDSQQAKLKEGLEKLGVNLSIDNKVTDSAFEAVQKKVPEISKKAVAEVKSNKNIC